LSTTNPTWTDPGANPGLHGERPATNDMSHDTALFFHLHPALYYYSPPFLNSTTLVLVTIPSFIINQFLLKKVFLLLLHFNAINRNDPFRCTQGYSP
jgi:hypothetical protein